MALAIGIGPAPAMSQGVGPMSSPPPMVGVPSADPRVPEGAPPTLTPAQPVPAASIPAVLPIEAPPLPPVPPGRPNGAGAPGSRVINLARDTTGLLPDHPPGPTVPTPPRPVAEVAKDVDSMIRRIQGPEAEINVPVGQTKLIETKLDLIRIVVANPEVADVELLIDQPNSKPRLLNLFGRTFGTTNLTLWAKDPDKSDDQNRPVSYLVRVTLNTLDLESRIKQTYPGALIHIRQVGPQVILEGQVPDAKTMSDVLQVVTADLRNSGGLRLVGGGAGAGPAGVGAPAGGGAAPAAGGAAAAPGTGVTIINRVHVPGPRQVLLRVKIAELNRDAVRQLGVSWFRPKDNSLLGSTIGNAATFTGATSGAGASGVATQTATGFAGRRTPVTTNFTAVGNASAASSATLFGIFDASQFALFLNALKSNSVAKILAEPNLMALDGQPAQFIAGGLFPYPVPQSSSIPGGTAVVTVQFAKFGAILTFLPQILANDVIRLDVEPIFSQLNFGQGTTINGGTVPAIDQRSARTIVELREGQTLAIAGLLQTTTSATTVRVPILGDLPVVGPLFSNNRIETVETELVVLVTPELVAPMEANEVAEAPGDRVIQPNDFEFYFLGRIEGKSGVDFRATVKELDPLDVMKHFRSEDQWVIGPHGHAD